MQEREYCIDKFNENFAMILGKRIAIYGCEDYAKAVVESFSEYQFVCVVDDYAPVVGKYFSGYYIVSLAQMMELNIEILIIAAPIFQAEEIYDKINLSCRAEGISVYNLYGVLMSTMRTMVLEKKMIYPGITDNDIKHLIDEADIISFDVDDCLFAVKKQECFYFYQEIELELWKRGICIDYFADKILRITQEHPYDTWEEIISYILDSPNEELISHILNVFYNKVKEVFYPRRAVVEAFNYAVMSGKKVCIIADMKDYRFSQTALIAMLEEYGINSWDIIINRTDCKKNKSNGLYRALIERYGQVSYLHIGDDEKEDVVLPYLYGINTFWVMRPFELLRILDPVYENLIVNDNTRDAIEEYVLMTYKDEYCIQGAEAVRMKRRRTAIQLEEKVKFYSAYGNITSEVRINYKPLLLEYLCETDTIDTCEKINFQKWKKPIVSIIIPVYNQFRFTYNCLKSIFNNTKEIKYEVIIADDCSTDEVQYLEKVVTGITVLHNKENLRFLLNCNNAAKYAKGKYILFLNNDTQVQPNWLMPLVKLMEKCSKAGIVGSKLVYPEGYLQEAGGIVWKDGSAWNYGHLKNPTEPEYSYVKEVDYISGAAIMIRSSLWKKIGGFDKTFTPAYYEDTDLAFEVRKQGYKVLYQPESVVVHFEGISNGIDILSGQKNFQIINQKKFYEKWKDVLGGEHFRNGEEVYLAKDRGWTKKQILVIDHYVPNFDKDAGGRCTFMYINTFIKLGMKVTFIGDNFARIEPYTTILNQLGVEVLYGDYYSENWSVWLKDNLHYFDYIYLQRPHISIKYIDLVKEYGRGKIIYFAHDLHHIRMYRDYLLSGNEEALKESEYWKKIEMELFDKADVGHVVGSYEQKMMQKIFPDKPIRNIPLYIYEELPQQIEKDFSKRKNILFVGGFNHLPNVDAVLWFSKNIFPRLLTKYPELVWHIVGNNAPDEVRMLRDDHIVLEGFVSDEKLNKLYLNSRLVVVPLRYGAGVKGKIVEAAYYQVPVVTTSIGGEGLDETLGSFLMENQADKMAELIESLYTDYDKLRKMSDAGAELVKKYFTLNRAEEVLLADMNFLHC